MKGKSFCLSRTWLIMMVIGIFAAGCSDGNGLLLPSDTETQIFDHTGGLLSFTTIDVVVDVPAGAVMDGEVVTFVVQVAPPDLPTRGLAGSIHQRIGWLRLESAGDPDIVLLDEITVVMPLDDGYTPGAGYAVFWFDASSGQWLYAGKTATITDDGMHAVFTADAFGTWGVFKAVPLIVEAHANRTTARAPASISLDALIDGGAPPYTVVWHFGDGSDPDGGIAISHLYELAITYTPTCVVVDNMGHQVSDDIDINLF